MRPLLSRFLYKLKTGFLTLPRRICGPSARKLQGASRTVAIDLSATGGAARRTSKRDSVEINDKTAVSRRACVQRTGGFAAGEALLHDAADDERTVWNVAPCVVQTYDAVGTSS